MNNSGDKNIVYVTDDYMEYDERKSWTGHAKNVFEYDLDTNIMTTIYSTEKEWIGDTEDYSGVDEYPWGEKVPADGLVKTSKYGDIDMTFHDNVNGDVTIDLGAALSSILPPTYRKVTKEVADEIMAYYMNREFDYKPIDKTGELNDAYGYEEARILSTNPQCLALRVDNSWRSDFNNETLYIKGPEGWTSNHTHDITFIRLGLGNETNLEPADISDELDKIWVDLSTVKTVN